MKFVAIQPLQYDHNGAVGLDGYYFVDEYKIIPCKEEKAQSSQKPWKTLILTFPFEGIEETKDDFSNLFKNNSIAAAKANKFAAWFALVTNTPTRLFYSGFGRGTFFWCWHHPASDYQEAQSLKPFSPDLNAPHGNYEVVPRPDFPRSKSLADPIRLPADMEPLTKKLFSLPLKERDRYHSACLSYQYGLEVWGTYPSVSLVAHVSAIESMMADELTSQYCKDAKRRCTVKRDVSKKFRVFFERTLAKPLPQDLQGILTKAYSNRSSYVHKALMGKLGLAVYQHYTETMQLYSELQQLSELVRAGLIQWLVEI
jgi:hypothetical protein